MLDEDKTSMLEIEGYGVHDPEQTETRHIAISKLMFLGDLSVWGNIKAVRSLAEPLQVGMDNGARRALVPLENKRNFLDVSGEIVEVDPVFFSDPMTAAMKALGMT